MILLFCLSLLHLLKSSLFLEFDRNNFELTPVFFDSRTYFSLYYRKLDCVLNQQPCVPCPKNCQKCSSIDKCQTCRANFVLNSQETNCLPCLESCTKCKYGDQPNYNWNNVSNTTLECNSNLYAVENLDLSGFTYCPKKCLACFWGNDYKNYSDIRSKSASYYLNADEIQKNSIKVLCRICAQNTTLNLEGLCVGCLDYCVDCKISNGTFTIGEGFYIWNFSDEDKILSKADIESKYKFKQICNQCIKGYYISPEGICLFCGAGCLECQLTQYNTVQCNKCQDDYTINLDGTNCIECTPCSSCNYILIADGSILKPGSSLLPALDPSLFKLKCNDCKQYYYLELNYSCLPCPTSCDKCGWYLPNNTKISQNLADKNSKVGCYTCLGGVLKRSKICEFSYFSNTEGVENFKTAIELDYDGVYYEHCLECQSNFYLDFLYPNSSSSSIISKPNFTMTCTYSGSNGHYKNKNGDYLEDIILKDPNQIKKINKSDFAFEALVSNSINNIANCVKQNSSKCEICEQNNFRDYLSMIPKQAEIAIMVYKLCLQLDGSECGKTLNETGAFISFGKSSDDKTCLQCTLGCEECQFSTKGVEICLSCSFGFKRSNSNTSPCLICRKNDNSCENYWKLELYVGPPTSENPSASNPDAESYLGSKSNPLSSLQARGGIQSSNFSDQLIVSFSETILVYFFFEAEVDFPSSELLIISTTINEASKLQNYTQLFFYIYASPWVPKDKAVKSEYFYIAFDKASTDIEIIGSWKETFTLNKMGVKHKSPDQNNIFSLQFTDIGLVFISDVLFDKLTTVMTFSNNFYITLLNLIVSNCFHQGKGKTGLLNYNNVSVTHIKNIKFDKITLNDSTLFYFIQGYEIFLVTIENFFATSLNLVDKGYIFVDQIINHITEINFLYLISSIIEKSQSILIISSPRKITMSDITLTDNIILSDGNTNNALFLIYQMQQSNSLTINRLNFKRNVLKGYSFMLFDKLDGELLVSFQDLQFSENEFFLKVASPLIFNLEFLSKDLINTIKLTNFYFNNNLFKSNNVEVLISIRIAESITLTNIQIKQSNYIVSLLKVVTISADLNIFNMAINYETQPGCVSGKIATIYVENFYSLNIKQLLIQGMLAQDNSLVEFANYEVQEAKAQISAYDITIKDCEIKKSNSISNVVSSIKLLSKKVFYNFDLNLIKITNVFLISSNEFVLKESSFGIFVDLSGVIIFGSKVTIENSEFKTNNSKKALSIYADELSIKNVLYENSQDTLVKEMENTGGFLFAVIENMNASEVKIYKSLALRGGALFIVAKELSDSHKILFTLLEIKDSISSEDGIIYFDDKLLYSEALSSFTLDKITFDKCHSYTTQSLNILSLIYLIGPYENENIEIILSNFKVLSSTGQFLYAQYSYMSIKILYSDIQAPPSIPAYLTPQSYIIYMGSLNGPKLEIKESSFLNHHLSGSVLFYKVNPELIDITMTTFNSLRIANTFQYIYIKGNTLIFRKTKFINTTHLSRTSVQLETFFEIAEADTIVFEDMEFSDNKVNCSTLVMFHDVTFQLKIIRFKMERNSGHDKGGLYLFSSLLSSSYFTIESSTFNFNEAIVKAAALNIEYCRVNIINTKFYSNSAGGFAGALMISTRSNFDVILENCTFKNNTAPKAPALMFPYSNPLFKTGNKILSETDQEQDPSTHVIGNPVFLVLNGNENLNELTIANHSSKDQIKNNLVFFIHDQYMNRLSDYLSTNSKLYVNLYQVLDDSMEGKYGTLLSTNQAKPSINAANTTVLSQDTNSFNLDAFNVTGYINSTLIIRIHSDAILRDENNNFVITFNGTNKSLESPFFTIKISIRDCFLGEIYQLTSLRCELCKDRFFSLEYNSSSCEKFPEGVESCLEGYRLVLSAGYWRESVFSKEVIKCEEAPENCLGGEFSFCKIGHTGPKCLECDLLAENNIERYGRKTKFTCSPCKEITLNVIRILLVSALALTSLAVAVKSTIILMEKFIAMKIVNVATKKIIEDQKSLSAVFLKIFVNYFQIIATIWTFNLEFPAELMIIPDFVGNPIEQLFYSLDCFIVDKINEKSLPVIYAKLLIYISVPFFYLIFFLLAYRLFSVLKLIRRSRGSIIITSTLFIFLYLQPNLVYFMVSLIACKEIGKGKFFIKANLTLRCYTEMYNGYTFYLVLPLLLVTGAMLPLLILLFMYKKKENLNKTPYRLKLGFLYNEYTSKNYFWEFVKMYERLCIINILLFFDSFIMIKGLLILLVITVYGILTAFFKPYASQELNKVDRISTLVCFFTIFFAIGAYKNPFPIIAFLYFLGIIIINCIFVVYLIRKIAESYSDRLESLILLLKVWLSKCKFLQRLFRFKPMKKFRTLHLWRRVKRAYQNYKDFKDFYQESNLNKGTNRLKMKNLYLKKNHEDEKKNQDFMVKAKSRFSAPENKLQNQKKTVYKTKKAYTMEVEEMKPIVPPFLIQSQVTPTNNSNIEIEMEASNKLYIAEERQASVKIYSSDYKINENKLNFSKKNI